MLQRLLVSVILLSKDFSVKGAPLIKLWLLKLIDISLMHLWNCQRIWLKLGEIEFKPLSLLAQEIRIDFERSSHWFDFMEFDEVFHCLQSFWVGFQEYFKLFDCESALLFQKVNRLFNRFTLYNFVLQGF